VQTKGSLEDWKIGNCGHLTTEAEVSQQKFDFSVYTNRYECAKPNPAVSGKRRRAPLAEPNIAAFKTQFDRMSLELIAWNPTRFEKPEAPMSVQTIEHAIDVS
jgi:hypothetical protein